ncbi:MAG TPA: hypothetical protein GX709_01040 [Clostridiales bacterium]|nr:hypothetical protein [Clostridiales bacterium]
MKHKNLEKNCDENEKLSDKNGDSEPCENKKAQTRLASKTEKQKNKKAKISKYKAIKWVLIVTVLTFVLAFLFSFVAEITVSKAGLIFSLVLLFILILINYFFDAIGVAATACEEQPFHSMASRKEKGAKMAIMLVKNADKVSSMCCDVIGDICGIISGACSISIVLMLSTKINNPQTTFWLTIAFSALVSAITVGGKALIKIFAIRKSKNIILLTAKFLSIFSRKK